MVRLQIGCLIILFFIAAIYFSTKRVKTYSHTIFSGFISISVLYVVSDIVTVYTVNHLETVPPMVNRACHTVFLGSIIMVLYLCFLYTSTLIHPDDDKARCRNNGWERKLPVIMALVGIAVLPLSYVETPKGNYSWGPPVFMAYLIVGIYSIFSIIGLVSHWKNINQKKRSLVLLALGIQTVLSIYQAIFPTSLTSSLAVTLLCLSFFLTVESPDVHLIEQLKKEKERADEANMAKSAFLSNMSHEIRTPMNAIIGMTEILLRSEIKQPEYGYLLNIKHSGAALLTIINDILDFSKIESGKLEIIEETYEPMSMLSDLSMIFLNRIGDKRVELLFDIDKELPLKLYGDSLRLRQIIINLVNNAIKFTDEGSVKLTMQVKKTDEKNRVELDISVKDTGQGIKPEDMDKLFGSFQQVDTKKNRDKEGTGLGLAISKQLVELMGGQIGVRSEYGRGSEFYFSLPQKVMSEEKAAVVKEENTKTQSLVISGWMEKESLLDNLKKLSNEYGLRYVPWEEIRENHTKADYLFVDESVYRKEGNQIEEIAAGLDTELCILQNPMLGNCWKEQLLVVNKPLYTLNFCQIMNHEMRTGFVQAEQDMNFTAPDAEILLVDDNEMNLKVAIGLLQPLQMKIDTAASGKKALQMVQDKHYHLVFMDHMMPVMDGVETTQKIRELNDEYLKEMPIIALTANAVVEARETFMKAGMNDFVAKPIEIKEICAKIRTWLPSELIQKSSAAETEKNKEVEELPVIEGLNVAEGVKNSGSLTLFRSLLGDFYKLIDLKATKIEKCLADGMIRDYTIEVHALKNTARMIGAMELSELFYRMEQLGNAEDVETIIEETPAVLELYRSYKPILEPYGKSNDQDKREVPKEEIQAALEKLNEAMDSFDLDGADEALAILEEYRLPENLGSFMESLRAYVADVAMEEVMETTKKMLEELEK